jgi:hypothetical protein
VEETTRVLTEASIPGRVGYRRGLRCKSLGERVERAAKCERNDVSQSGAGGPDGQETIGRLIPAGTGFDFYRRLQIAHDEPPPLTPPSPEELWAQREMDDSGVLGLSHQEMTANSQV